MRSAARPDDYFPKESIQRGEMGRVVLRARISPSHCATSFAVVVRSGYPDLDAAAIQVAEHSQFAAAVHKGHPQESEMNFAVNFVFNRADRR